MPYQVMKRGQKYRLFKPGTQKIAKNRSGTALDGGGHESKEAAERQARAIMSSERRRSRRGGIR